MQPALLIRLRPTGPWRFGPGDGGEDRSDTLYRSDRVFSAATLAMRQLGLLEEWLEATARAAAPEVVFSSLFPYQGDTLFAPPPATMWPPDASLLVAPSPVFLSKIRWSAAHFVPLAMIESILTAQPILADQWIPDPDSGCLLRRDRPSASPFRTTLRTGAAIDRISAAAAQPHSFACVEFEPAAGLWCVARFADAAVEGWWSERVKACFRVLADTGFGGRRTVGWGKSEEPRFQSGGWPNLLFPKIARIPKNGDWSLENGDGPPLYWLLSLYLPAAADAIDWTGGDYRLMVRGGRVESPRATGEKKKAVSMVTEGSVLATRAEPVGAAIDVAPDGFAHPVYRAGFAIALQLPYIRIEDVKPVEVATDVEAPEARPCPEPEPVPLVEIPVASAEEKQEEPAHEI